MEYFEFTKNKENYTVEWEILENTLMLYFLDSSNAVIGNTNIKLLGKLTEVQLKNLVRDYWKSFAKNKLNKK